MHHPVQFQITAKNIQKDRLRAAQASRLASQSRQGPSPILVLPLKLLGAVQGLLMAPIKAMKHAAQKTADVKKYQRETANRHP